MKGIPGKGKQTERSVCEKAPGLIERIERGVLGAYHEMMVIWSESEARTRCIGQGKDLGL